MPGRNRPCPCGSGKKYKICCIDKARVSDQGPLTTAPTERYPRIDPRTSPDPLNHGYLRQNIYAVTFVRDPPLVGFDPELRPEGYPGTYTVEFTLQPPARVVMDTTEYKADPDLPGSSLLRITSPSPRKPTDLKLINIDVTPPMRDSEPVAIVLRYTFLPNDNGLLSTIRVTLRADGSQNAQETAHTHLMPVLADMMFLHDVPLDIARIRTEELATNSVRIVYTRPAYAEVGLQPARISPRAARSENYHPLALYAQALSSSIPLFQYLCFYKVAEMIGGLRRQIVDDAKQRGEPPGIVTERIEESAWLIKNVGQELRDEVIGRTMSDVVDHVLRPHRVRIAHAFLDDEGPTERSAFDVFDETDTYRLLPLAKYVARRMISTHFKIDVEP